MSAKKETTHIISEGELVLYRRERSSIWQCRYKVGGVWQRASTKERKLKDAKEVAKELRITAEIRKRDNLPVITRKFRDVAKLAVQRMEQKLANGDGKVSYKDYIRIITEYLIPILGNRLITNIDSVALDYLDAERIKMMGREPSHSTLLSHNAALNIVFDEGVLRNFLTELNRPKLESIRLRRFGHLLTLTDQVLHFRFESATSNMTRFSLTHSRSTLKKIIRWASHL